ncbi:MAG: MBL fold metallo-hydrolase [Bacilli bacterium]
MKSSKEEWFTIDEIDNNTFIISEYRHWEESHCYLLNGEEYSLLIDTGLGIENIKEQIMKLTDKPVIAVATHIHWDHIGGHKYFPDFYAHEEELNWLNGEFPLSMEQIKGYVVEDCDLPDGFDIDKYEFFQGKPVRLLKDKDVIDIGGRTLEVLHTPGHSPGHMCFFERDRGYLFTGDLVYIGTLFAYYPSTDPVAYLKSIKRVAALPVQKVYPAHHDLDIPETILSDMEKAFVELESNGLLCHGSGTHTYGYFSVWL